ncbi:MAG: VWA domain-containing protein [Sandaracinaceae bacterium]|nr:VWA domain-containing protein [Sandaracinaceae bacterium]
MRNAKLGLLVYVGVLAGCGGAQTTAEREDPQLVVLEGQLGNEFVSAGEAAMIVSRVRVTTRAIENAPRPPINLALVVDTSGSMQGAPIDDARDASLALLDTLGPEDRLAVIAFSSETEVLLPSTRLGGADMRDLRRRISRMEARGTTDLAGGLRVGLEELVRNFEPEGINRLVLLSDGVPNDPTPILPPRHGGRRARHPHHGARPRPRLRRDAPRAHRAGQRRALPLRRGELARRGRVHGRGAALRAAARAQPDARAAAGPRRAHRRSRRPAAADGGWSGAGRARRPLGGRAARRDRAPRGRASARGGPRWSSWTRC